MREKPEPQAIVGTFRVVRRFLWWPTHLHVYGTSYYQNRWLEWANIQQCGMHSYWEDNNFMPEEEE